MTEKNDTHIVLLSASPLLALGVQQALHDSPCREIGEADLPDPGLAAGARLLVLIPFTWEEMRRWLATLTNHRVACPWLCFGDLRIAGAFVSYLPGRCGLAGRRAQPGELWTLARALEANRVRPPTEELRMRYAAGIRRVPEAEGVGLLSGKELEYACGVSLHMSPPQIAVNEQVKEGTVKTVLQHARQRFPEKKRGLLGWFIEQALDLSDPP